MLIALGHLSAGLLLLYFGGETLVRGAASLAHRVGIRPLVAGLTIVAFGTSAPELAVALDAAVEGYSDVAVGSVVGSNICNIGLILGLSALIAPIQVDRQLFRIDIPVVLIASALLIVFLLDGELSRLEGASFAAGIILYTVLTLRRKLDRDTGDDPPVGVELAPKGRAMLLTVGGLIVLAGGGYLAVHGGVELAAVFGVSNAVIALTVVAIGTSLPELVTSIIASARSETDIAVGNVVGSNIFNLLCVLGITAMAQPLVRGGVDWSDLAVMFGLSILVVPLARSGLRLGRAEGALLVICYLGYLIWRVVSETA